MKSSFLICVMPVRALQMLEAALDVIMSNSLLPADQVQTVTFTVMTLLYAVCIGVGLVTRKRSDPQP